MLHARVATIAVLVVSGAFGLSTGAAAADTVTTPFPGITYTHRSQASPRKEIHILEVDLTAPQVSIRTTRSDERGKTPSTFSSLVGAAAVVNGDFFNTDGSYDPTGLAIGEGVQWDDGDNAAGYRFIACTAGNACTIAVEGDGAVVDPTWRSAVGGRRLLVKPGFTFTSDMDTSCGSHCTTQHPRTAVGLKDGGATLVLVVVEGRQDPIFGLKISQLATLMSSLGCEVALELDGGGSSTMIVDGGRVSGRPDNEPAERRVANHIAILYDETPPTTGRLVGYVREGDIYNSDAPIAGATVTLSTGETTATDSEGLYEFDDVPAGPVTITATQEGYAQTEDTKEVTAGITNWKSLALVRLDDEPPPEDDPTGPPDGEGTTGGGDDDPDDADGGSGAGDAADPDAPPDQVTGDAMDSGDGGADDAGAGLVEPGAGETTSETTAARRVTPSCAHSPPTPATTLLLVALALMRRRPARRGR